MGAYRGREGQIWYGAEDPCLPGPSPITAIEEPYRLHHNPVMPPMDSTRITTLLKRDPLRWHVMGLVEALGLPQGCIGAGFVRNLVWDHLHGQCSDCRDEDIDVLFHDPAKTDAAYDAEIEADLRQRAPDFAWSVKNQARMHLRNGDAPYASVEDAMRFWPETATAIACLRRDDECSMIAPFGTGDLIHLILRPTSTAAHKLAAFDARLDTKGWQTRWPLVQIAGQEGTDASRKH